jgi:hypothetical protein
MILLSFASLIGFHVLLGCAPVDLALTIAAGIALLALAADRSGFHPAMARAASCSLRTSIATDNSTPL